MVAYIEIAATLLVTEKAPIDDVLAYLREARRRSSGSGYTGLCAALTAVAWIAQGRESEGQGALTEVTDPDALARFEANKDIWLPEGLLHAIVGVAVERDQPELAATHYRELAASPLGATAVGKLGTRARPRAPSGRTPKRGAK